MKDFINLIVLLILAAMFFWLTLLINKDVNHVHDAFGALYVPLTLFALLWGRKIYEEHKGV